MLGAGGSGKAAASVPSFLGSRALGGTCLEDKAPLGNASSAVGTQARARAGRCWRTRGRGEDSCAAMPRAPRGGAPPAVPGLSGPPGGSGAGGGREEDEAEGRGPSRRPAVAESERAAGASAPPQEVATGSARGGGAGRRGAGLGAQVRRGDPDRAARGFAMRGPLPTARAGRAWGLRRRGRATPASAGAARRAGVPAPGARLCARPEPGAPRAQGGGCSRAGVGLGDHPGAPGPGSGGAEPVPGRQPPIGAPGAGEPSRPPGPLPGRRAAVTAMPGVERGAGRGAVARRRRGRARLSSSGTDRGEEPAPGPGAFGLFVCERLVPRARSLRE